MKIRFVRYVAAAAVLIAAAGAFAEARMERAAGAETSSQPVEIIRL